MFSLVQRFEQLLRLLHSSDVVNASRAQQSARSHSAVLFPIMVLLADKQKLLSWKEIQEYKDYVKEHGVSQFLNLFEREKHRTDPFKWGDETEYTIVKFDDKKRKVYASLRSETLLGELGKEREAFSDIGGSHWVPEVTLFQLESTPGVPFEGYLNCFKTVEENMTARRKQVRKHLRQDEALVSFSFPSVGVPDYSFPATQPHPTTLLGSVFVSDEVIHSGYQHVSQIFRERRGERFNINVPVFKDETTLSPYIGDLSACGTAEDVKNGKPDHIYMDHFVCGISCCCLQVTFQAVDFQNAKYLYDQLMPLTPIVLALSASTPIYRSTLSDVDARWNVIAEAVDERTPAERGLQPLKNSQRLGHRFGTAENYISEEGEKYNDIDIPYDEKTFKRLVEKGHELAFAKFVANIMLRDPLQLTEGRIELDDETDFLHCDTLFCSVWNNLRFKPPPSSDPKTGWRVEFRPTEIQLTDFENAAFCSFLVLCNRVITCSKINTLIPASMVVENMKRAQRRDAVLEEKFFFRNNLQDDGEAKVTEMTVNEIINGSKDGFTGLIPLIHQFLDSVNIEVDVRVRLNEYLDLIVKRASGEVMTTATWIRNFVRTHPSYQMDSRVPDDTVYDLVKKMDDISNGRVECRGLLGTRKARDNLLAQKEEKEN